MTKKRRISSLDQDSTTIIHLPKDILFDIFLRLPVKSIITLSAACKLFSTLTSDPAFVDSHGRRATPLLLFQAIPRNPKYITSNASCQLISFVDGIRVERRASICTPDLFNIVLCCDSLLCFREVFSKTYHVYNALSREVIWSSTHYFGDLRGFYFHPIAREYRLLWATGEGEELFGFHILSLRSNTWRRIANSAYRPPSGSCHLSLHGRLHWLDSSYDRVVVFDIKSENFSAVPLPFPSSSSLDGGELLVKTKEGCVGVCRIDEVGMQMESWVLQDEEVWVRKYRISLTSNIPGIPKPKVTEKLKPLCGHGDGELILGVCDANEWAYSALILSNVELDSFRTIEMDQDSPLKRRNVITFMPFVESLDSCMSFKKNVNRCSSFCFS
ncbi:F-box/kelch-repeat protein At3g06240-like [Typha angustifolia]|uniref:F-box/kelch-repeat protein At3g06240-like n=1 Tax=Typha angustifolia TaxID=59011 RepID=UPI003C2FA150